MSETEFSPKWPEISASPELLAALDEADLSWEKEGGIPLEEVRREFELWDGK